LSAPYPPEELLKDVVGALGIDRNGSIPGIYFDRIGKELVTIFVDLVRHFMAEQVGCKLVVLFELLAEVFHALADGQHGFGCTVIVEAIATTRQGDTHNLTQVVKDH